MTAVPAWLTKINRVANLLYDHNLGWLLSRRILRLSHVGRRSGQRYVISGFGKRTDWLRNLDAGGPATVTVGRRSFPVHHRTLDDDAAFAVVTAYERRNRMITPVVRRGLSWLLGWSYHGTDADRRRLVAQLPVIGLRPHAAR